MTQSIKYIYLLDLNKTNISIYGSVIFKHIYFQIYGNIWNRQKVENLGLEDI